MRASYWPNNSADTPAVWLAQVNLSGVLGRTQVVTRTNHGSASVQFREWMYRAPKPSAVPPPVHANHEFDHACGWGISVSKPEDFR